MEAEETILKLERAQLNAEVKAKQAIIDAQAAELLTLRKNFADKAKEAERNADSFKIMMDELHEKV